MRTLTTLILIAAPLMFSSPLLGKGKKTSRTSIKQQHSLPSLVKRGVFEVLVPKFKDRLQYDRPLPTHRLSYMERNDRFHSIGTAFAIDDKHLISAAHVFQLGQNSLYKKFFVRDYRGRIYRINLITKLNEYRDIIEFTLSRYPKHMLSFKQRTKSTLGEDVCAPGNAIGKGISLRCNGQVASKTPEPYRGRFQNLRFSTPVSPGNSGGPLVDRKGRVLGVITKKSPSENLNVAVPIIEYRKMNRRAGYFYSHDSKIQTNNGQVTAKPWLYKTTLPKSIRELKSLAKRDYQRHYKRLLKKHERDYKRRSFPLAKGFRNYLQRQERDYTMAAVTPQDQSLRHWHMAKINFRVVPLQNQQTLLIADQQIKGMLPFHMDRPQNQRLDRFLNRPDAMLDELSLVMGMTRTVGDEKVRIVSFGQPKRTSVFRDRLGRQWTYATWFITHNNSTARMFYTPTPKGAWGLIEIIPTSLISPIYLDLKKRDLNMILTSYSGTSSQFSEFMKLRSKPDIFKRGDIYRTRDRLSIELGEIAAEIPIERTSSQDQLDIKLGYSPYGALKATPLAIFYKPDVHSLEALALNHYFQPGLESPRRIRQVYSSMVRAREPFDAEVRPTDRGYIMNRVLGSEKRRDVWLATCNSLDEEETEDNCEINAGLGWK